MKGLKVRRAPPQAYHTSAYLKRVRVFLTQTWTFHCCSKSFPSFLRLPSSWRFERLWQHTIEADCAAGITSRRADLTGCFSGKLSCQLQCSQRKAKHILDGFCSRSCVRTLSRSLQSNRALNFSYWSVNGHSQLSSTLMKSLRPWFSRKTPEGVLVLK